MKDITCVLFDNIFRCPITIQFYLKKLSEIFIVLYDIFNIFYFVINVAEKMKKGEVLKDEIAGKLEEVVCRCPTAKAEETYVECSSCSEAGNDYS